MTKRAQYLMLPTDSGDWTVLNTRRRLLTSDAAVANFQNIGCRDNQKMRHWHIINITALPIYCSHTQ